MRALHLLLLLLISIIFAKIPPPSFNFQTFDNSSQFLLNGASSVNPGYLSLNDGTPLSYGSIYFYEKVYINDFKTFFSISIDGTNQSTGGDGIAFVIQSTSKNALANNQVGGIGYGSGINNDPDRGIAKSIAIEFDTFLDPSLNDPSDNHISVHTNITFPNSANEVYSLKNVTLIYDMRNTPFNITITWDEKLKIFAIFYNQHVLPVLTVQADLYEVLNTTDEVWVGFSASSNQYADSHKVLNWNFQYNSAVSPQNSLIYGVNNISAGTNQSFYIQAVDQYNHNISTENQTFTVYIEGENVIPTYMGEGLFFFQKYFTVAKSYQIQASYMNNTLGNSPQSFEVFPASVYPPNTVTNGKMGGIAGAWVSFQMTLKDQFGNIATNAPANTAIEFKVTGPGSVESNHSFVHNGVVTLGYSATVAGSYSISIKVQGQSIPGSPFSAEVSDGAIDAAFCSASGTGVSAYGSVSEDNTFGITIRDQYQNVVTVQPTNMSIYIQIVGPKGNFPIYDCDWNDTLKQYVVNYRTTLAGFYQIHVKINDEPIYGSPYSARILPETVAFPNLTKISGITPYQVAGIQNMFTVTTFDQYNNQLETNSSSVIAQVVSSFENIQTYVLYAGHGVYTVYWTSRYENWGVFINVFVNNVKVAQYVTDINSGAIDPSKCSLDGIGYISTQKNVKSRIVLKARDSYDNIVRGYHSFTVTIKNAIKSSTSIDSIIQSLGNGTFYIFYTPKHTGQYILDVQYRGQDIRDSPSFLVVNDSVKVGVIIGIVVASVTVVTIISAIVYFYWLKYKSKYHYQVLDEDTAYED